MQSVIDVTCNSAVDFYLCIEVESSQAVSTAVERLGIWYLTPSGMSHPLSPFSSCVIYCHFGTCDNRCHDICYFDSNSRQIVCNGVLLWPVVSIDFIQILFFQIHVDFRSPACLRALTQALLKDDFQLDIRMPLDRLIPTVPLRLNYILWLEDIFAPVSSVPLKGIDIGNVIMNIVIRLSGSCHCQSRFYYLHQCLSMRS